MKILIAGAGKVGRAVTRKLSAEGHDLTLIDTDPAELKAAADRFDVMSCEGNCATMATLREAGVMDADVLIAATTRDEVNLLCCMTAVGMNPDVHTIARIRDPAYLPQVYAMQQKFSLSMTVNPEKAAAEEIERLIRFPGFLRREAFARGKIQLTELRVGADSPLKDLALRDLGSVINGQMLVCCVLRDGKGIIPSGDFVLRQDDRIFVTGSVDDLASVLKSLGIITRKVRKVFICGGGTVSYYLALQLSKKRGMNVKIIEKDPDRCRELEQQLPDVCVVNANAGDMNTLDSEWASDSDAFISLTGLDELNILLSMYADSLRIPQIVTKVGRGPDNFRILDDLPIGAVICPKELCCNSIVRYIRAIGNQEGAARSIHFIADGQCCAIEFEADAMTHHLDEPLKDQHLRDNALLACIIRRGKTIYPNGETVIKRGDTVIVVSDASPDIRSLNDIFEDRAYEL